MEIIQIVGFKNSGKTTLASKLIAMLSESGHTVASLKHHGHGGAPIGLENTDSEKHKQAGAVISGVEGDGILQLSAASWDVEQMLAIYQLMGVEVLVIEGFKKEPFPKVVLIQRKEEVVLLEQIENVKAVLTPLALKDVSCPVFNITEIEALCMWIMRNFLKSAS
ncbi:molybdopterin-guanine dinucleotide biosynthesis protein B [Oceanobacillus polygoni]|uniref:Molybdopterin-guanine dinucleotide biosynthesis protein B n=1 Tax=Oceanobacillus polygoni TaxID=1235259 RepID=A0A9X1CL41_9BACI|nr:molybdopterin-guanine dinucleotide biosynthesis protein B [Oceanobacillus polygoni]MBP2079873.1 molybdopterin-guanine dinucleotide biosynthesis protein B [Oceanobacillus polygoni]